MPPADCVGPANGIPAAMAPKDTPARYAGPPMTLGNMRANGVRTLIVYCVACHRDVVFNVDGYGDDVPVLAFSPADGVHAVRHDRFGFPGYIG
jgi:hypothetical protein